MKRLLFLLALPLVSQAQAVFTPPVAPTPGTPGKLVATAGTGTTAIVCTLTGDAAPAKNIAIACTVGGVVIGPYSMPIVAAATSYTFQHNFGANAVTVVLKPNATAGVDMQCTINGATPVSGTF